MAVTIMAGVIRYDGEILAQFNGTVTVRNLPAAPVYSVSRLISHLKDFPRFASITFGTPVMPVTLADRQKTPRPSKVSRRTHSASQQWMPTALSSLGRFHSSPSASVSWALAHVFDFFHAAGGFAVNDHGKDDGNIDAAINEKCFPT